MKNQNRNTGSRGAAKKEKAIMIASSVFVLAALTMTGIYVNNNNKESQNDGYNIDFDMLENEAQDNQNIVEQKLDEIEEQAGNSFLAVPEDDLDYAPVENVDSGMVEIPGLTDNGTWDSYAQPEAVEDKETVEEDITVEEEVDTTEDILEEELAEQSLEELEDAQDQAAMNADAGMDVSAQEEIAYQPDFVTGDTLVWPVSGSVLIPYSMDKTVFFSTLEQYKYNPAMVLAATEGDIISAVAGGRVTDVFYDEEIGNAVTVDIGNGYEVTYGQLKDIAVAKGSYIEKGSLLGYVAAPTIYYSVEGTNAYFKLTLNGEPVDPLGQLQ